MTVFAHKGRLWNTKPNKCKKCGNENESILQGIVHLSMEHKIHVGYNNKAYLEYLEMLETL